MRYWILGVVFALLTLVGQAKPSRVGKVVLEKNEVNLLEDLVAEEKDVEPLALELPMVEEDVWSGKRFGLPIEEEFLEGYFAQRPGKFLLDPQGLLKSEEAEERLRFLNDHAGESGIDLFVYVFRGNQEVQNEVRTEELMERLYEVGRPAVVVFYYMGEPERALMMLSPRLADVVSGAEARRVLESSVIQAQNQVDASGQLEKFLGQVSIRTYLLERLLEPTERAVGPAFTAVPVKREQTEAVKFARWVWLREQAGPWLLPVGGGLVGAVLLAGLLVMVRRRGRFYFVDLEVEPRLGGAHAAGVGAVISFATASVPPASQREQMPDFVRRA